MSDECDVFDQEESMLVLTFPFFPFCAYYLEGHIHRTFAFF